MTGIIDYDIGNLRSVQKAVMRLGHECIVTRNAAELDRCDNLILPGVGNFKEGIANLKKYDLPEILSDIVLERKRKIMGICLGMQLMTSFSEEGDCEGLGWIKGRTKFFRLNNLKVPHIGWNTLEMKNNRLKGFSNMPEDEFYFVHSYYVDCENRDDILFTTDYGLTFVSGFMKENIMGVQFHPEKSHKSGLRLLKAFLDQ